MKIQRTEKIKSEVDVSIESVGLHMDEKGITAMVTLEDGVDEHDGYLISWEDVLSWAMSSSQEGDDVENILRGLRGVADALEAWDNSFSEPNSQAQSPTESTDATCSESTHG